MHIRCTRNYAFFLSGSDNHQFSPGFYRDYPMDPDTWKLFIEEVVSLCSKKPRVEHFMGTALVKSLEGNKRFGKNIDVFDGYRNLMMVALVSCALAGAVKELDPKVYQNCCNMVRATDLDAILFFDKFPKDHPDRVAFYAVIRDEIALSHHGSPIMDAYQFFRAEIDNLLATGTIQPNEFFYMLFYRMLFAVIEVDEDEDPVQFYKTLHPERGIPLRKS